MRIAHADSERVIRQLAKRLAGATGLHAFEIKPESPYAVADPLPSIARITVIEGLPEPVRVAQGADGAVVLVLVVDPSSSEDLPDLDFVLPPAAPAEDIGQLEPGVTTSFADLKFTETNAYNHYSENRLLFRLPDDWLMLSSAQALIELTYSFAPGLPADSLILVKVNDTTVRLLPLETGGGEVLAPLDIGFPANLLNPGPNELNFVSIVPGDPADMSCPASEQPLATILEDSTLTVEATPKMALVGLRSALTSMGADDVRFIGTASDGSQGDEQALALASALRPITGRRPGQSGSLSVVSDQALDEVPIAGLHLSRRDLERVLLAPTPATEPQEERSMFRILPDRALSDGIRRVSASLSNLAKPGEGSLAEWIDGRHGQAVLLLPDADAPNDLWLITAADSDPVQVADAVARARTSPYGPKGRISVLTEEGAWQSWQDASAPPVLLEPLTLRNFRAISGTYASWSPLYFVAILFAFTIMSVMAALTFVVTTRGKRKR